MKSLIPACCQRRIRVLNCVIALAGLGVTTGCMTDSGPECFPVRGEIRLDKAPLAEAMIVFHPVETDAPDIPRPLAYSDAEGTFELTTNQPKDGAPPGEYAVTVELRELKQDGDVMVRDGKNLLPERYANPATSGLRFTIETGQNELPVIDLQSR